MAELQALQRVVWGDVSYEQHLAVQRSRVRRAIATVLMAVGVVVAGLGLAVTTLPGTDERTQRDLSPPRSATRATRPVSAERDRTVSTARPALTAPAATRATPATIAPAERSPHALAHTGARTGGLLVVAVVLVAAGVAILFARSAGRRARRRSVREARG